MNEPRHGHTATRLSSGKVLIIAGLTKTSPLSSMELFDPTRNKFKRLLTAKIRPRGWHRVVGISDKTILVTGGWTHGNIALRQAAVIRPDGELAGIVEMQLGRYDHTATRLRDGGVLITGGNDGKRARKSMEVFRLTKKTFEMIPRPMFLARQQHSATLLQDGRVLIVGGARGTNAQYSEIFDPGENRTRLVRSPTAITRGRHTATLLQNGQVLIAGGLGPKGTLRSAERFDPAAGQFTLLQEKMTSERQQHTATLLPDGRVLIAGGWGNEKSLASVDLYDPNLKCFIPMDVTLRYERRLHTATLLDGNRVLIAGGASDSDVLANAEVLQIPPREKTSRKCAGAG